MTDVEGIRRWIEPDVASDRATRRESGGETRGRLVQDPAPGEFVEEAKALGLVQKAIDRAEERGITVSAPGDSK